ncbi:MAG: hypothetical protein O2909_12735 [Chloroflexi bacterium]|nr:hypothetical protein [Chloroflexota bacterium]MDA1220276.1 hypothetical protein [Chloroflexota bacterium]
MKEIKEFEQHFDLSPHTQYYEEKFNRRRVRGRISYLFIFFGLSVSALLILAVIMLMRITASFTG